MNTKEIFNLTASQKNIWLIETFHNNTNINNIVGSLKIDTPINVDALKEAVNIFIKNNDSFRTRIIIENNIPKQYFDNYIKQDIEVVNISNESELQNFNDNFVNSSINVLEDYLFIPKILVLPDHSGYLYLCAHHLIMDAYGMSIFVDQTRTNYLNMCSNEPINDEVQPSYIDFINSHAEYFNSEKYLKAKNFWEDTYETLPNILKLKSSWQVPISSDIQKFNINSLLMDKITNYCKEHSISENVFFLSIFSTYFKHMSDNSNFIIGNPSLNRSNFKEKKTSGMFVSIMPFNVHFSENQSFQDFCTTIAQDQKQMYRHLSYPYEKILNFINDKHNYHDPLFDVVFSYQNFGVPSYCKWYNTNSQIESLQIHIKNISSENNELTIHYHYLTNVFTSETITLMNDRIFNIISQVLENENILVDNISILSETEKDLILNTFNDTYCEYNKSSNIVTEFEKIVSKYPNNVAVKDSQNELSYEELNNRANIVASKILELNLNTDIIAFSKERSIDIFVTILGILKSGHTYMPIDPEYPINRIKYMLEKSECELIITSKEIQYALDFEKNTLLFEDIDFNTICSNPNIPIPSDKLSYIMFTSGSTGTPKAVSIKHHNVLNFANSMHSRLNYNPQDNLTVISVTTVCFDIFVFELFPTILSGLTLFIASEIESKSPKLLSNIISTHNISKILTTPSRIELLFTDLSYIKSLNSIQEFLLGGEPLTERFVTELKKHTSAKICDLYGPTETTVYSTFKDLSDTKIITIGKPIGNTQVYILNKNNIIMPLHIAGEICIAGDGVGSGYYKDFDRTSEVFIKNPYGPGLLYKTGDLGYYQSNGEIICLGRRDNQIKIRGFRIELEDIINNILQFSGMLNCVVIDRTNTNGEKYLCAYYISNKDINISELKSFLLDSLPNYMIPTYFIKLDKIPLTINHKVDKKALPDPISIINHSEEIYVKPVTDIEVQIHKIICEALNIKRISIVSDIFEHNIDSLAIINIQTKMLELGFKLNTQDFYKYRTIQNIAKLLDNQIIENSFNLDTEYLSNVNNSFNKHSKVGITYSNNTFNNILLLGSTGYLGIHILNNLIKNSQSTIYCLIRSRGTQNVEDRIVSLYKSYFNESLDLTRVVILDADITQECFGLDQLTYSDLSNTINLVINSAANVRYYGDYEVFRKINVTVVENISQFCLLANIKFVHISTLGVSGNYLIDNEKNTNTFNENDFFIGQQYNENVYIQTKFEAEEFIYNKVKSGLNASIIRVGNLTSRYSDGQFQNNFSDNAFYNILLIILKYKMIPSSMLNQVLEFTPIEYCAAAISRLIFNVDLNKFVFHLFNQNYLNVNDFIEILNTLNYAPKILSGKDFNQSIVNLSILNPDEHILKGVINDLDDDLGLSFIATVKQENDFTNNILDKLNFKWPTVSSEYIKRIITYLIDNNYL